MLKTLGLFVSVFLLVGLSSCSDQPLVEDVAEPYKIIEGSYIDNEITVQSINIRYPQISGLGNMAMERYINKKIEVTALGAFVEFTGINEMDVNVTYSLHLTSSNTLSLSFLITTFHTSQAYPLIRIKALNIDLETGGEILLEDIINTENRDLYSLYRSFFDIFKLCGEYDENPLFENEINRSVSEILSIENLYSCGIANSPLQSWFTEEDLFIGVQVRKAEGSYAIYKAKFSELMD
ncbi:MAG: DUF4163 domain-containing protein [Oscillospiraceae bacterium]|nr:DUF4163 domain-containing protein [Oscillospiraceae bacterium]